MSERRNTSPYLAGASWTKHLAIIGAQSFICALIGASHAPSWPPPSPPTQRCEPPGNYRGRTRAGRAVRFTADESSYWLTCRFVRPILGFVTSGLRRSRSGHHERSAANVTNAEFSGRSEWRAGMSGGGPGRLVKPICFQIFKASPRPLVVKKHGLKFDAPERASNGHPAPSPLCAH